LILYRRRWQDERLHANTTLAFLPSFKTWGWKRRASRHILFPQEGCSHSQNSQRFDRSYNPNSPCFYSSMGFFKSCLDVHYRSAFCANIFNIAFSFCDDQGQRRSPRFCRVSLLKILAQDFADLNYSYCAVLATFLGNLPLLPPGASSRPSN